MDSPRFLPLAILCSGAIFAQQAPTISGCPSFPANSIWNTPVDTLPVHPHSADYISHISSSGGLRYDISIPVNIVPGTQPMVTMNLGSDESDPGPYPFPPNALIEGGSDAHVLVVDKDNCMLYETFASSLNPDGSWNAYSGAKWSLLSNALRPDGWTSADAAGLPIMPGLLRYDEMIAGQINHALRFTAPSTQRLYVWPGRHYASSNTSAAYPPMGQRFRLKASFDISGYSANMQVVLRALKKYGLMLADNGLPWEMQAILDTRWDENDLLTLRQVIGSNLEAVDVSSLMIDPNSGQASAPGVVSVTVTPATFTLGPSQQRQFTATVAGSNLGVMWSLNPNTGAVGTTGLYTAPASVGAAQNVSVIATLTDGSKNGSATVNLLPAVPALASVAVTPGTVVGGNNVSVTVTLTLPAQAGGVAVALSGSNAAFPAATVTVAAGQISQTFSLPTAVVTAVTSVTVTAAYNGATVQSSALTVNPVPAAPASAAFVKSDTATGGSWKGVYGADGSGIVGDSTGYPSYVTVTPAGYASWVWASSTADTRGLLKAASTTDRIAACWYGGTSFTIDLTFKDTATHQAAFYLVDWDRGGRSERVDILDTAGGVLDSRSVAGFGTGQYLVWNLSGHVVVRFTNTNSASNAVVSGLFFGTGGVATPPPATGAAAFVKTDTATAGSWKGVYGSDGSGIVGDTASYPSYVTVTPAGNASWVWASSTTDTRGLLKTASTTDRIAGCWYSGTAFTIDLAFKDTATHQAAFYLVDWDNAGGGRAERVDVLDANNTVLDSRPVTAFGNGQYLVWNLSGHVIVRFTNTNSASNAVVSGLFFGTGGGVTPPAPTGTAAFLKTDTATAGTWKGVYGNDGAGVIGDTSGYPSYVTVTPSGNSSYVWASSTTNTRALQKLSSTTDRVAACWYSGTSFTIDLAFKDTAAHQVALYLIDWDNAGGGRAERVDILDANNTVLDSRSVTAFGAGQYLVWNLSGHVIVRVTNTNSANAVASGLFFGGSSTTTGTAAFLKTDTATAGSWKGVYGADGAGIVGDTAGYPSYVTVTPAGNASWVWASSTTDARGLLKAASTTDRVAACWYSGTSFTIDLAFTDSATHQVAFYLVDWDNSGGGRAERVDILDASNNILDSRSVTAFGAGQYLVWNLTGHVIVRITNTNSASNAVLSGIFFR